MTEDNDNITLSEKGKAHEAPLASAAVRLYSRAKSNRRLRYLPTKSVLAVRRKQNKKTPFEKRKEFYFYRSLYQKPAHAKQDKQEGEVVRRKE